MFSKVRLRPEITPKRVYALLKLIDYKNGILNEEEIYKYIQPNNIQNDSKEVKLVFKFCKDNNLIDIDFDNKVILKINKEVIKDESSFRRFMTKLVYDDIAKNTFYLITEKILCSNLDIYDLSGFENILLSLKIGEASKESILGWRFWAAYLGYGFILNGQFVLNPHLKLKDFIEEYFITTEDKQITMRTFIETLIKICPEFRGTIDGNIISTHLSIALVTLENLNIIKSVEVRDSSEKWSLNLNNTSKDITHIEFLGGE